MAPRRTRGERVGLTRARVIDAALAIVDRDGLAALSMRRLGTELGVEAMTVYHHVPGKEAVLDGLVERVLAGAGEIEGDEWSGALRTYAVSLRAALLAHPGVLPLALSRPATTPEALALVERGLHLLTTSGFEIGRALDLLNALTVLVVGHTIAEAAISDAPAADYADLPLLRQAALMGVGTSDEARFRFAVDALLAGAAPRR
ncbi:TetR/AcrR family transcriptional regulator C-terminal domain-containing protein [Pseudonocardia sp. CA-107938]|uniref:TetR/AcrR family transcriptional regulator C-terminal domain-containing protein n=1 Tax=Pseudonocardia sp. CA-107938 TaxID=3240021 RepID=UPI003D9469FA